MIGKTRMKSRLYLLALILLLPNITLAHDTLDDLTGYLQYLAERDKVLSQNIANADTPKYTPKDLSGYSQSNNDGINFLTPNSRHIRLDENVNYQLKKSDITTQKPNGNEVNIEHEMFKKSTNAVKLQEVTNLYSKTKHMLKTAITGGK